MNLRSKYRIIIEDESRLENIYQVSATLFKWSISAAFAMLVLLATGAMLVVLSPARKLLPGYLKDSERAATEEQQMRVDSLQQAYHTNAAFLDNIINVLNPACSSEKRDSLPASASSIPLSPDSLLPVSPEERKFAAMMRERERYNISVIAPLAAESMMFSQINESAVITEKTRDATTAVIAIPNNASVAAIADGTVIAVYRTLRDGGGSSVIIQHPKGFLSRCSRLGTLLVEPGDIVTAGQIIAMPSYGTSRKNEIVNLEMWHNGTPLIPYEYLVDTENLSPHVPIIDDEVGRGRL